MHSNTSRSLNKYNICSNLIFSTFLGDQTAREPESAIPHPGPKCNSRWRYKGRSNIHYPFFISLFFIIIELFWNLIPLQPSLCYSIPAGGAVSDLQSAHLPHRTAFRRKPRHPGSLPSAQRGESGGSSGRDSLCLPGAVPAGRPHAVMHDN